ncbi:MAG TPA: D-alanyl-lipoteichoic acid biosynthesis protein DltD [Symbiobacteriaceae bacterium]|nr:D-alanyl-lipoteichoic acid biosynthesis protein DltD [Symbiobacteriaceae bacterium]
MQLPRRLRAGLIAFIVFLMLGLSAQAALGYWVRDYLDNIAPTGDDEAVKGVYLTRMALSYDDRLVLMGSSELTFQDRYHAARLFANKPTGFSVYVVGSGYRQSIHNFLALSALGKDLKGKQIVLFVSPTWFTKTIGEKAYRKNFSTLQAYEFVYAAPVSPELKRRGARRLLELGGQAAEEPLLRSALDSVAHDRPIGYAAGWPLGRLALEQYRGKDTWDVARLIVRNRLKPARPTVRRLPLDWQDLMNQATAEANAKSVHNPFGMSDDFYKKWVEPKLSEIEGSERDANWMDSTEWNDLQLTLDLLKELEAKPLFISLPVLGQYSDFKGHPAADRRAYYAKVKAQIESAGFPVVDLSPSEYEPAFHSDPWHQGWKGSVTIAQKLDQFYHGTLPEANR